MLGFALGYEILQKRNSCIMSCKQYLKQTGKGGAIPLDSVKDMTHNNDTMRFQDNSLHCVYTHIMSVKYKRRLKSVIHVRFEHVRSLFVEPLKAYDFCFI